MMCGKPAKYRIHMKNGWIFFACKNHLRLAKEREGIINIFFIPPHDEHYRNTTCEMQREEETRMSDLKPTRQLIEPSYAISIIDNGYLLHALESEECFSCTSIVDLVGKLTTLEKEKNA